MIWGKLRVCLNEWVRRNDDGEVIGRIWIWKWGKEMGMGKDDGKMWIGCGLG